MTDKRQVFLHLYLDSNGTTYSVQNDRPLPIAANTLIQSLISDFQPLLVKYKHSKLSIRAQFSSSFTSTDKQPRYKGGSPLNWRAPKSDEKLNMSLDINNSQTKQDGIKEVGIKEVEIKQDMVQRDIVEEKTRTKRTNKRKNPQRRRRARTNQRQ